VLSSEIRTLTIFDQENDTATYLKAFAEGKVFDLDTEPDKQVTGNESPHDICMMAIALEKDSIIFYMGLADLVSGELDREILDRIIREEMSHIAILSNIPIS
jgi:rubrerythrin